MRMTYVAPQDSLDGIAKVIYESKDGKTSKTFEALDWLVRLRRNTYIPNKGNPPEAEFANMDFTQISRAVYAKKPVPMIEFRR